MPLISKSKYLSGLACHRLPRHEVHAGDLPELAPGLETQFRLEQGMAVEERARAGFPGGVLVRSSDFAMEQRLEETAPPRARARRPRAAAPPAVARHLWVARAAGLPVPRAYLMPLNKDARAPALERLFVIEEVTKDVTSLLAGVRGDIAAQRAMLAAGTPPAAALVRPCRKPAPCPLFAHCWPRWPEHHVSTLYQVRWKQVEKFLAEGRETVDQLDEMATRYQEARRQIRAVRERRRIVEDGLAAALDALKPPVAWLDFETVGLAIPAWPRSGRPHA